MMPRRPLLYFSFVFSLPLVVSAQGTVPGLSVTSLLPANHAKDVPPDTHLNLTFKTPPGYGTSGQVRIFDAADDRLVDTVDLATGPQGYTIGGTAYNAYPMLIGENAVTIYPHPGALNYNKTYYVQMDSGAVKNEAGNFPGFTDKTGWTFTTKAAAPAADFGKIVVAADGTGDFATVQAALDFIPPNNTRPVTIFIRKGVYNEIVNFANKSNLTLLGEDRMGTVIAYPNNPRLNANRSVLQANNCPGLALVNLTMRDTTPKQSGGNQAETIIVKGTGNLIISHCSFYSFQDTIQIDCPAYVTDCQVEGDIDFLWGTGAVFYNHCDLKELTSKDSVLVLRNPAGKHGAVLLNCKIDTAPGVTGAYLEQNQGYANSEVVLLNCALGPGFNPLGWRADETKPVDQVHNWEFNSTNLSDGKPVDVSGRAKWSKQLTMEKDAETIANYSKPAFILGGWSPALAPIILAQPAAASVKVGESATFSVTAAGLPNATYQWQLNGTPLRDALKDPPHILGSTSTTLQIDSAMPQSAGLYTVVVTTVSGSVTSAPAALTVTRAPAR